MSKNNPNKRQKGNQDRLYDGKKVVPVLFIDPKKRRRYIAAQFDNGNLVTDPVSKEPIPYKNL